MNSLKMKISVIFGVAHMCLGLVIKASNFKFFKSNIDYYYVFIPQLTLILCLFGWMNLLIVIKWLTEWGDNAGKSPSIVGIMINMFLNYGAVDSENVDSIFFTADIQQLVCVLFAIISVLSILCMLFVKPFLLIREIFDSHQKQKDKKEVFIGILQHFSNEEKIAFIGDNPGNEKSVGINLTRLLNEDFDESNKITEIVVHQLIETIEFSLGTISNTASYLRLWALSLAHSQLSDVFFDKLIHSVGLSKEGNPVLLSLAFPIYASFTIFVLLLMDSLECFLHTLRLHWVEFQNKFYKGDGYKYVPFSSTAKIQEEIEAMRLLKHPIIYNEENEYNAWEMHPTTKFLIRKSSQKVEDEKCSSSSKSIPRVENTVKEIQFRLQKAQDGLKINFSKINSNLLNEIKERINHHKLTLSEHKNMLEQINISEEDPEDLYSYNNKFSSMLEEIRENLEEKDQEIRKIEHFIKDVDEIINNGQKCNAESLEHLERMFEKCRNCNSKIDKLNKGVDGISTKQGVTIERLIKFFKDSKLDQLKRCSPITISNNFKYLNERMEFCEVVLETMKSKSQAEIEDGPKHLLAKNDLQSKVLRWTESVHALIERQSAIKSDYETMKDKVQEQKHSKLDMKKVRSIIVQNTSFLEASNAFIFDVDHLINEIKEAEQDWKEYEKSENYQKVEWFDLHYETSHCNLASLKDALLKMNEIDDYNSDKQFINSLVYRIDEAISLFPQIKETFDLNRQFISEINRQKHEFCEDTDIIILNDNIMRINRTVINLDECLDKLKNTSSGARKIRDDLGEAFIQRNIDIKSEQINQFSKNLAVFKQKFNPLLRRTKTKRNNYNTRNIKSKTLEEVESLITPNNSKLMLFEAKLENDFVLKNQALKKIKECNINSINCMKLLEIIELVDRIKIDQKVIEDQIHAGEADLGKVQNMLDKLDADDELKSKKSESNLSNLLSETTKLINSYKEIKLVFDLTDGYTSDDDEDQLYSGISKDLSSIIANLNKITEEITENLENNRNSDIFEQEIISKIKEFESILDKHTHSLQLINWNDKLKKRKEDYKESVQEFNDILADGKIILDDLSKISKSTDVNTSEEFSSYIDKVTDTLALLKEKQEDYDSVALILSDFELSCSDCSSFNSVVKMVNKNKDVKEGILKILDFIDSLDGEIDEIESRRNEYVKEQNRKYKAKKGDEVDEMIRKFLGNSEEGVVIKRMAEGRYMIGEKKVSAKILNEKLLIRVGGGYQTLEEYLKVCKQARLKRDQRKEKRETRLKRKRDKRARTLRYSGITRIVPSSDVLKGIVEN